VCVAKVRATQLKNWSNFKGFNTILDSEVLLNLKSKMKYSRICLIRHRVFRQFAQFFTFSSVPAEFLSFVYISVRLIRQFAQFVTSFYSEKRFVRLIRHLLFRF